MNMVSIIVIFVVLLMITLTSKKHSNIFLAFGLVDIFLRLINYVANHTIKEIGDIVNRVFPDSIPGIITHYTDGVLSTILVWGYIILMIIFFVIVFKLFVKRY